MSLLNMPHSCLPGDVEQGGGASEHDLMLLRHCSFHILLPHLILLLDLFEKIGRAHV